MSVVKINALTVPADKQARFEERFAARPVPWRAPASSGSSCCARWRAPTSTSCTPAGRSEADSWPGRTSQDFDRAHDGGGDTLAPAAADSHHLWSYEVLESAGPHADQAARP